MAFSFAQKLMPKPLDIDIEIVLQYQCTSEVRENKRSKKMKKQKVSIDWSSIQWLIDGKDRKPVDEMSIAELMGPCPSCGDFYSQSGECPVCGDTVSPKQIEQRRQWLKEHPEGDEE